MQWLLRSLEIGYSQPQMRGAALAIAGLALACQIPEESTGNALGTQLPLSAAERPHGASGDAEQVASPDPYAGPSTDPIARSWSVRYRFPVVVGYTDFDIGSGEALDSLATLALVPTADFVRPLTEEWTLIPFLGLGAGWLLSDDVGVVIFSTGVRAEWVRRLDEASAIHVLPRVRYDANLNRPDGFLGDWGRADLAVELRHMIGSPSDKTRLEAGVYAQGFWFWDDVEFDVPGLAPDSIGTQLELGLSLGTHEPIEILGLDLPRVFLGVRFGDGAESVILRFGEL